MGNTKAIKSYYTEDEKRLIEKAAAKCSMKVASYIRYIMLRNSKLIMEGGQGGKLTLPKLLTFLTTGEWE